MTTLCAPTVSVVIACHTEERWALLLDSIRSVEQQTHPATQIVVVVDHNSALLRRLQAENLDVTLVENDSVRGASGARNTGARLARTPIVAFLDDDATAEPDWLAAIVRPFRDVDVIGVGGRVMPAWSTDRPGWFPPEFDWVVGASYAGMPTAPTEVRNVWAENMAVRREVFHRVGGFRVGFGKLGSHSRPEDTDVCIRMAAAGAGGRWMYEPTAVVHHYVSPLRSSYRFFLGRVYHEGRGKAELARLLPTPATALRSERDYVRRVLPTGLRSHLGRAAATRELAPVQQAANIVIGLSATVLGFVLERTTARLSKDVHPVCDVVSIDRAHERDDTWMAS